MRVGEDDVQGGDGDTHFLQQVQGALQLRRVREVNPGGQQV